MERCGRPALDRAHDLLSGVLAALDRWLGDLGKRVVRVDRDVADREDLRMVGDGEVGSDHDPATASDLGAQECGERRGPRTPAAHTMVPACTWRPSESGVDPFDGDARRHVDAAVAQGPRCRVCLPVWGRKR